MKYPLEKRRPSTHHERLHREIALILETRHIDPHSGQPSVDTRAKADLWYNLLTEYDRRWVIELFHTEIYSEEQSDEDRGYLLDTLCRWDCDLTATISLHLWKHLPVDKNLILQTRIAYCSCFPYGKDTEDFLLTRFFYWEKKLFLEAARMEWDVLEMAKKLVTAIANVIAFNSFSSGLNLYPRCIMLTHLNVFYDIQFLCFLTHTVSLDTTRSYLPVSAANLGELSRYLLSNDPKYIDYLKRRQKNYSSLGEPLKSLIVNLKPYHSTSPTLKLQNEVLTLLKKVDFEHDKLQVTSDGEFELVMTKTLKSQRELIEKQFPFMRMGIQVLANELLAPTAAILEDVIPQCHIKELVAINTEHDHTTDFVIRFEIAKV